MGIAVCGTHYIGMFAAQYELTEENYSDSTKFLLSGSYASKVASHGSLLLCYWLASFAVVKSLRDTTMSMISKFGASTVRPMSNVSLSPPGATRAPQSHGRGAPQSNGRFGNAQGPRLPANFDAHGVVPHPNPAK